MLATLPSLQISKRRLIQSCQFRFILFKFNVQKPFHFKQAHSKSLLTSSKENKYFAKIRTQSYKTQTVKLQKIQKFLAL